MIEYNNDYQELEDLRQQVSLLRDKLSGQELITRRSMMNSIRQSVRKINNHSMVVPLISLFSAVFSFWAFRYFFSFSFGYSIFTVVVLTIAAVAHVMMHRRVMTLDVSHGNLVEVAESVERLRRGYAMWPIYSMPVLVGWMLWLFFVEIRTIADGPLKDGFLCGCIVGVVVGGFIGLRMRRHTMNQADDIICQIRDLQEDN